MPRFTELQVYQAILESLASEHSARMVAMRNATDNAKALVDNLTLVRNKARQSRHHRRTARHRRRRGSVEAGEIIDLIHE